METAIRQFDSTVSGYLGFLDNEYVSSAITTVLVLYASLAAPKLPEKVTKYFDNMAVKVAFMFLIVLTSRKSPSVALITAVGLMVTLLTLNRHLTNRKLMKQLKVMPANGGEKLLQEEEANNGVVPEEPEGYQAEVNDLMAEKHERVDQSDEVAKDEHQVAESDLSIYKQKEFDSVEGWDDEWESHGAF